MNGWGLSLLSPDEQDLLKPMARERNSLYLGGPSLRVISFKLFHSLNEKVEKLNWINVNLWYTIIKDKSNRNKDKKGNSHAVLI